MSSTTRRIFYAFWIIVLYCLIGVMNGEDNWRKLRKLNLHFGPKFRFGRKEKAQMTGRGKQERGYRVVKLRKFGETLILGKKNFNSCLKLERRFRER